LKRQLALVPVRPHRGGDFLPIRQQLHRILRPLSPLKAMGFFIFARDWRLP
jgi:hypothetical protein